MKPWLAVSRYARIVRGVAYRVLRDTSEADDLLQDVPLSYRLCKPLIVPKAGTVLDSANGYRRAIHGAFFDLPPLLHTARSR